MKKMYGRHVYMNFALIVQFGVTMLVPTFLMLAIGLFIENKTGLFTAVPFLVLGMAAGFRNMYVLGMKANSESDNQERILKEKVFVDEATKKRDKN